MPGVVAAVAVLAVEVAAVGHGCSGRSWLQRSVMVVASIGIIGRLFSGQ